MKTATKQTPMSAFLDNLTAVDALIAMLHEHAENHFGVHPDVVHWGHVGDVCMVRDQLQRIVDQLGLEK